jgi:hypothetical protein
MGITPVYIKVHEIKAMWRQYRKIARYGQGVKKSVECGESVKGEE